MTGTTTTRAPFAAAVRRRLAKTPKGSPFTLGRVLAVYGAVMTVVFLAGLDQTIVATALPHIVSSLGGLTDYSWVFTSYLLLQTISIPIYGKLGDIYGRRNLLLIAIVIFIVASALCGAAQNMIQLTIFRALQGLGAGGLIPLAMAVIAEIIPPRERGRYQALLNGTIAAAAVLGPTVGGLIVDHGSWRWIFYVNIPVGAVALAVVALTLRRREIRHDRSVDYLGAALLAGGTTAFLLALIWGGQSSGWLSAQVLGAAAAAAVLLTFFALVERRAPEPILPFSAIRVPTVAAGTACWCMSAACMFGAIAFVPLFTQGVLGESATSTGLVLIPLMLGIVVASTLSGQWISRTGRYRPSALAGAVVLAVGMTLLWRMDIATTRDEVARNVLVCGVGIGLMNHVFIIAAQNAVPKRVLGATTSTLQFGRAMGTALGVTLFGVIVNQGLSGDLRGRSSFVHRLGPHEREQLADALHPAFLFGVVLAVATFVLIYLLMGTQPLRKTMDDPPALPETP